MIARVILAVTAEADDGFIWDQIGVLQTKMFEAGPVQIKFAFFGREGSGRSGRSYISTRWASDADDLGDLIDHGRTQCECGCFIDVNSILEEALRESERAPVGAVVLIGDHIHSADLDRATTLAEQLRAVGTRVFVFQQQSRRHLARAEPFELLAEITGGANTPFNPAVERVAQKLPELFRAIGLFAIGGNAALQIQAQENESARFLLEQMTGYDVAPVRIMVGSDDRVTVRATPSRYGGSKGNK